MAKILNNNLLAEIRADTLQRIEDNMTIGAFGTGTTAPTAGDTALVNEVEDVARIDLFVGPSSVLSSFFLGSALANSNTISEFGVFDAALDLQQRAVLSLPVAKTSDKELWVDVDVESEVVEE